jgi:hypothetical protein
VGAFHYDYRDVSVDFMGVENTGEKGQVEKHVSGVQRAKDTITDVHVIKCCREACPSHYRYT